MNPCIYCDGENQTITLGPDGYTVTCSCGVRVEFFFTEEMAEVMWNKCNPVEEPEPTPTPSD